MSHNTRESPYPTRYFWSFFFCFYGKVGLSSACWLQSSLSESAGTSRWFAKKKNLVPVEQVVSGHHAQEASWISDRVKLVVELLELLVQQISRLALRLAARTASERERQRDGVRDTEMLAWKKKRKTLQQSVQQVLRGLINYTCSWSVRKHTLFNPHTLGLISQAWSNTLS